jgi:hypothetical protein
MHANERKTNEQNSLVAAGQQTSGKRLRGNVQIIRTKNVSGQTITQPTRGAKGGK